MPKIFINHTNHPSAHWSTEQITAAKAYGEILDIAFPNVEAEATADEVRKLAQEQLKKILEAKPAAVLCQGEFNYTFAIVEQLKSSGVTAVAATSKRVAIEETLPDGSTRQVSTFHFVQFREY